MFRISDFINRVIKLILLLLMFVIAGNLFFGNVQTNNRAIYSNFTISVFALCFIIGLLHKKLVRKIYTQCLQLSKLNYWITNNMLTITMHLSIPLIYIWYNTYYKSGSDLWTIDYAARVLINQNSISGMEGWLSYYYGIYPNNILLTWIYAIGLWLNKHFGVLDADNGLMMLIVLNTLISCMTIYITYKCVKQLFGQKIALLGWLFGLVMIGLNPYNILPYSDSFAVFLSISILLLYLKSANREFLWIIIAFIGTLAFFIKPQSVIILIAIFFNEILLMFSEFKLNRLVFYKILYFGMGIIFAINVNIFMVTSFSKNISFDTNKKFPTTHWIMMGMNEEAKGGYSSADVDYSAEFDTIEERKAGEIDKIKERINQFGCTGYIQFLVKKTGRVFCDGTFNYSTSTGDWYNTIYDEKNMFVSSLLRNIYYYSGSYYPVYSTIIQFTWSILLLLCCLFSLLYRKIDIISMTLIGIIIFELIFEGQARHLYCNVPIFILCAMGGLKKAYIYCEGKGDRKNYAMD